VGSEAGSSPQFTRKKEDVFARRDEGGGTEQKHQREQEGEEDDVSCNWILRGLAPFLDEVWGKLKGLGKDSKEVASENNKRSPKLGSQKEEREGQRAK